MALDQEFDEELEEGIEGKEMTFVEHLEELRWHLLRSIASILIFTIVAWIYREEIFGGIIMDLPNLTSGPTECCVK
jgi:sec-independent protein translocase protein TatC